MQKNNNDNSIIAKRFSQLIEYLGISRYKMAKETGISETVLQNILNGKNSPSTKITVKILSIYKMINAEWWLLGEGEMLKKNNQNIQNSLKDPPALRTEQTENEVLFLRKQLTQMHDDNSALIRTLENMSCR
jgi:transcriptional regulator with XRE-family HTH domain